LIFSFEDDAIGAQTFWKFSACFSNFSETFFLVETQKASKKFFLKINFEELSAR